MAGWHPNQGDGGLLANPADPGNPAAAFAPTVPPVGTAPLYYGSGCDVRLRPHVLNSLISENLSVVDRVGLAYNPNSLVNLRTAIEYIQQKGLPSYAVLTPQGVPVNYYTGSLDPPLFGGYNNGMVLCVVPTEHNQGFVRIDLGGGWWVPVLRNDYGELQAEDWPANIPQIIAYFNGAFFLLGLAKSQVPLVLIGSVNFWIRPDGSDELGDGSENTAARAFRTIAGAWAAVGSRYAGSPGAAIVLRLGIPGTYEAADVGPFGASVWIIGDPNARDQYRIVTNDTWVHGIAIRASGINSFILRGVNLVMTNAQPRVNGVHCLWIASSRLHLDRVQFTLEVSNPMGYIISAVESTNVYVAHTENVTMQSDVRIIGLGQSINSGLCATYAASFPGTPSGPPPSVWYWENISFSNGGAGYVANINSSVTMGNHITSLNNTAGLRWISDNNSLVSTGQPYPGNVAGWNGPFSTGGPGT